MAHPGPLGSDAYGEINTTPYIVHVIGYAKVSVDLTHAGEILLVSMYIKTHSRVSCGQVWVHETLSVIYMNQLLAVFSRL